MAYIRVRKKTTGETGMMPEENFNPMLYEQVGGTVAPHQIPATSSEPQESMGIVDFLAPQSKRLGETMGEFLGMGRQVGAADRARPQMEQQVRDLLGQAQGASDEASRQRFLDLAQQRQTQFQQAYGEPVRQTRETLMAKPTLGQQMVGTIGEAVSYMPLPTSVSGGSGRLLTGAQAAEQAVRPLFTAPVAGKGGKMLETLGGKTLGTAKQRIGAQALRGAYSGFVSSVTRPENLPVSPEQLWPSRLMRGETEMSGEDLTKWLTGTVAGTATGAAFSAGVKTGTESLGWAANRVKHYAVNLMRGKLDPRRASEKLARQAIEKFDDPSWKKWIKTVNRKMLGLSDEMDNTPLDLDKPLQIEDIVLEQDRFEFANELRRHLDKIDNPLERQSAEVALEMGRIESVQGALTEVLEETNPALFKRWENFVHATGGTGGEGGIESFTDFLTKGTLGTGEMAEGAIELIEEIPDASKMNMSTLRMLRSDLVKGNQRADAVIVGDAINKLNTAQGIDGEDVTRLGQLFNRYYNDLRNIPELKGKSQAYQEMAGIFRQIRRQTPAAKNILKEQSFLMTILEGAGKAEEKVPFINRIKMWEWLALGGAGIYGVAAGDWQKPAVVLAAILGERTLQTPAGMRAMYKAGDVQAPQTVNALREWLRRGVTHKMTGDVGAPEEGQAKY